MKDGFIRNEIGSEFWDIPVGETARSLLPPETKWFVSGTGALEYIIRDIRESGEMKRVGIPSWCCSCMIHPFVNAGVEAVFYSVYVDDGGTVTCDYSAAADCDATLVLSYFGYTGQKTVGTPGGILIRDLTHSLFTPLCDDARYYFGSLRKWAGFWTGGYAWKRGEWQTAQPIPPVDPAYLTLRKSAMENKLLYLQGSSHNKDYLSEFEEAEEFLDNCCVMGGCQRDTEAARHLDGEFIRRRRRENAALLLGEVGDMALFPEIRQEDCPMFVPILFPDKDSRDHFRRYLIGKEIYCPVHWPVSELHRLNDRERYLYEHSLSLVCDQRYDAGDMQRICDAIRQYKETLGG